MNSLPRKTLIKLKPTRYTGIFNLTNAWLKNLKLKRRNKYKMGGVLTKKLSNLPSSFLAFKHYRAFTVVLIGRCS